MDYHFDVRDADNYLATGGLGEVIGFTMLALQNDQPRVQMDSDMAMALCILAQEAINARTVKSAPGGSQ